MAETLKSYLETYTPEIATQVQLKMPEIKKIELPKLKN